MNLALHIVVAMAYNQRNKIVVAGWSSLVARRAHNPKVVGSNPAPATIFLYLLIRLVNSVQIALLKFNFISGKCNLRNTIGFLLVIHLISVTQVTYKV